MTRFTIVVIAFLVPAMASAESRAYIGDVQGVATLERDGAQQPASIDTPMFAGDRIRTRDGRVDVVFPDRATLVIDHHSEVEFLTPFRVRVIAGTIEHRQAGAGLASYHRAPYGYVWYAAPAPPSPRGAHRHGNQRNPYRPPTPDFRVNDDDQPLSAWPTRLIAPREMPLMTRRPQTVSTSPAQRPPAPAAIPPAGRHLVTAPVGGGVSTHTRQCQ